MKPKLNKNASYWFGKGSSSDPRIKKKEKYRPKEVPKEWTQKAFEISKSRKTFDYESKLASRLGVSELKDLTPMISIDELIESISGPSPREKIMRSDVVCLIFLAREASVTSPFRMLLIKQIRYLLTFVFGPSFNANETFALNSFALWGNKIVRVVNPIDDTPGSPVNVRIRISSGRYGKLNCVKSSRELIPLRNDGSIVFLLGPKQQIKLHTGAEALFEQWVYFDAAESPTQVVLRVARGYRKKLHLILTS